MAISHIMSILKILTDLCANAKRKNKKHFCKYCVHCFKTNSKQTVRLNKTVSCAI